MLNNAQVKSNFFAMADKTDGLARQGCLENGSEKKPRFRSRLFIFLLTLFLTVPGLEWSTRSQRFGNLMSLSLDKRILKQELRRTWSNRDVLVLGNVNAYAIPSSIRLS